MDGTDAGDVAEAGSLQDQQTEYVAPNSCLLDQQNEYVAPCNCLLQPAAFTFAFCFGGCFCLFEFLFAFLSYAFATKWLFRLDFFRYDFHAVLLATHRTDIE